MILGESFQLIRASEIGATQIMAGVAVSVSISCTGAPGLLEIMCFVLCNLCPS